MSEVASKWGVKVAERGFSQLPNYLTLINQYIDPDRRLSSLELLLLIQLSGSWWKKAEMPFPAMRTLAVRCGASERQVLRAISHLEELNLLKRVKRRSGSLIASNAYDLSPLVTFLEEIAQAYPNEFPRNVRPVKAAEVLKPEETKSGEVDVPSANKPKRTIKAKAIKRLANRDGA
jgi:DNA-binding transcriptional MocR family regulator